MGGCEGLCKWVCGVCGCARSKGVGTKVGNCKEEGAAWMTDITVAVY